MAENTQPAVLDGTGRGNCHTADAGKRGVKPTRSIRKRLHLKAAQEPRRSLKTNQQPPAAEAPPSNEDRFETEIVLTGFRESRTSPPDLVVWLYDRKEAFVVLEDASFPCAVSLRRLLPQAKFVGCTNLCVTDAVERSSEVRAGSLFAVIRGTKVDGRQFLSEVQSRGASGLLVDSPVP